jgi:hypothetical protein
VLRDMLFWIVFGLAGLAGLAFIAWLGWAYALTAIALGQMFVLWTRTGAPITPEGLLFAAIWGLPMTVWTGALLALVIATIHWLTKTLGHLRVI